MRGVKCSWKEMQTIHRELLPSLGDGKGKKFNAFRCVGKQTATAWARTSELMSVLEKSQVPISVLNNFQPSHAVEISRHFRKIAGKPPWSEAVQDEICDWVNKCEHEELQCAGADLQIRGARGRGERGESQIENLSGCMPADILYRFCFTPE